MIFKISEISDSENHSNQKNHTKITVQTEWIATPTLAKTVEEYF